MKKRDENKAFGHLVKAAIVDAKLKKPEVAAATGIDLSTLYRKMNGAGIDKATVIGIVRSINRLAGSEIISERAALRAAGYPESLAEDTNTFLVESIADYAAELPTSAQEDVLTIVKALHRKHARSK